jgi:kynurenine formamidase
MDSRNATYDAFSVLTRLLTCSIRLLTLPWNQATSIPVEELDSVAKWQGLHPDSFTKPGDFLVVRTGFTKQYLALPLHEQSILPYREERDFIGVEASDKTLRWLWEKKLALVGSDNPAFESMPFNATIGGVPRSLHQVFIGGWGQSIGTFFFLFMIMH